MKRIVEHVGIGDVGTGTPSGTLQIAPQHIDDVGLVIMPCQGGTQTGDLLQIYNNSNAIALCADCTGKLWAASWDWTDTSFDVIVLNASVVSANTLSGQKLVVDGTGKVCATTLTATTASGFTNLYTSLLTADKIDMSNGTIKKICTTTITATTASGFTSLYATTVTATTGNIDAINAQTVSAATMCAELIYANLAPGKIGTITLTATTASGFTNLYTATLTATRADITTVNATTLTANNMSGGTAVGNYTPLYTHSVGICATAGTTVATATYIAVPASSTVFIHALVSTFETVGISAAGAGGYEIIATASSGGKVVTSHTNPATAIAQGQSNWIASIVAGVDKVALTMTGSGESAGWAYVLDTCRITCAA